VGEKRKQIQMSPIIFNSTMCHFFLRILILFFCLFLEWEMQVSTKESTFQQDILREQMSSGIQMVRLTKDGVTCYTQTRLQTPFWKLSSICTGVSTVSGNTLNIMNVVCLQPILKLNPLKFPQVHISTCVTRH
jgi:hypothetical protein